MTTDITHALIGDFQVTSKLDASLFLKHLGFRDFLITKDLSISPFILQKRSKVWHTFDCFSPKHVFVFFLLSFVENFTEKTVVFQRNSK